MASRNTPSQQQAKIYNNESSLSRCPNCYTTNTSHDTMTSLRQRVGECSPHYQNEHRPHNLPTSSDYATTKYGGIFAATITNNIVLNKIDTLHRLFLRRLSNLIMDEKIQMFSAVQPQHAVKQRHQ